VLQLKDRLENGLEKMRSAADQVAMLQENLKVEVEIVNDKKKATDELIVNVGQETAVAEVQQKAAAEEEAKVAKAGHRLERDAGELGEARVGERLAGAERARDDKQDTVVDRAPRLVQGHGSDEDESGAYGECKWEQVNYLEGREAEQGDQRAETREDPQFLDDICLLERPERPSHASSSGTGSGIGGGICDTLEVRKCTRRPVCPHPAVWSLDEQHGTDSQRQALLPAREACGAWQEVVKMV
jgi:hypothetical protein